MVSCSAGAGAEAGGGTHRHVHGHGRRVEALRVSTATPAPQLRGAGGRRGRALGGRREGFHREPALVHGQR